MAVLRRDPWGDQQGSFENLTQKKAVGSVVKAVTDAARAVAGDAKEQLTGDYGPGTEQNKSQVQDPAAAAKASKQVQDSAGQQQQNLLATRKNIEEINKKIQQIRFEQRQKKEQAEVRENKVKEEKKVDEKKKREEPFWRRALRGKTGSKEGNARASG